MEVEVVAAAGGGSGSGRTVEVVEMVSAEMEVVRGTGTAGRGGS